MIRIGTGYDLHRLTPGRPLILGGVAIPCERGLAGHSDADVLAHAITDALLGAAALGNIGQHFPDTDPRYAGADSLELLGEVVGMVREAGWAVVNVDATIISEAPKLNPHLGAICVKLADRMSVGAEFVSVKAKTNEGLGPEGRGEAISVHAVALIESVTP